MTTPQSLASERAAKLLIGDKFICNGPKIKVPPTPASGLPLTQAEIEHPFLLLAKYVPDEIWQEVKSEFRKIANQAERALDLERDKLKCIDDWWRTKNDNDTLRTQLTSAQSENARLESVLIVVQQMAESELLFYPATKKDHETTLVDIIEHIKGELKNTQPSAAVAATKEVSKLNQTSTAPHNEQDIDAATGTADDALIAKLQPDPFLVFWEKLPKEIVACAVDEDNDVRGFYEIPKMGETIWLAHPLTSIHLSVKQYSLTPNAGWRTTLRLRPEGGKL